MFWNISREFGTILKSHGTKGEVVVATLVDIPNNFNLPESVFLVIDGLPVPFFIEYYTVVPPNTFFIKFEEINDRNYASLFYNCSLRIENKFLKKIKLVPNVKSLIGYSVFDDEGTEVGKITGIMDIPMNPLVKVLYKSNEVLLPANGDTLLDFNDKEKKLVLFIPDGLLD